MRSGGLRLLPRPKRAVARAQAPGTEESAAWHHLSAQDALERLETRPEGLTSAEAGERLARLGRNEIARRKPVSPLGLLARQFANFFVLVLLFAAALAYAVSFMPGEAGRRLTAFFILGIVALSVGLSFFQEYRAQRELEALDRLLVFKATVIRDGAHRQIDAAGTVPGDILVLSHGQKVPADARVIESHGLRADESALTGESVGADKSPEPVALDAPLAERSSMVFGSTFITHGSGLAVAVRTGMQTEVGRIAATLEQMAERPTPFQVEVQRMARQMTAIVAVLAAVVAIILLFALHEPPADVAVNTLSLAVATIPESLPIVLTFALALGAHHMAARRAVVRRLSVVESLGSVDTICTDKTGTLTQNAMAVQGLFAGGQLVAVPQGGVSDEGIEELLRAGVLCSEATDGNGLKGEILGDPVDTALYRAAQLAGLDIAARAGRLSQGERDPVQLRAQDDDDRSPARRRPAGLCQGRAGDDTGALYFLLVPGTAPGIGGRALPGRQRHGQADAAGGDVHVGDGPEGDPFRPGRRGGSSRA